MKQKYGLIGFPLEHSFSKRYFTEKFLKENIQAEYGLFPLNDIRDLSLLLKNEPLLRGLNVTIPFKKSVISYLSDLSPEARAIGAVNTIKIQHESGKSILRGYNTDAPAFESEIRKFTGSLSGNALVTGTGGAAQAACYVLRKLGWQVKNATRIIQPDSKDSIVYTEIGKEFMAETKLIVNATPVGMFPDTDKIPGIPVEFLTSSHYIFDMIYNPAITRLMHAGKEKGSKVCNGLGMLHLQAELAWKIWQEHTIYEKK